MRFTKQLLLIFVLANFCINCNYFPPKFSTIPSDAFFVDDNIGGVYIKCDRNPEKEETYKCEVYNNRNGEILSEGIYAVGYGNGNPHFDSKDKEIYKSYDIGRIFLRDGRCLVKVTPSASVVEVDADACLNQSF